MKHKHQIAGDGHRIRFYANGTIKIRLYGTHHAEVEAIAGRDGHADAVLQGCNMTNIESVLSAADAAARFVTFAKAQLARIATANDGAAP